MEQLKEYLLNSDYESAAEILKGDHGISDLEIVEFVADSPFCKLVRFIHQAGVDIHIEDELLLRAALEEEEIKTAIYICENGADVTVIEDSDVNYILKREAAEGHYKMIKALHACGADINFKKGRLLISAAQGGNVDLLNYLLDNGLELNYLSDAVLPAVKSGDIEMLQTICSLGGDIEPVLGEGIRHAAEVGDESMLEYLVQDCQDKAELTAILTDNYHELAIVKILVAAGADFRADNEALLKNAVESDAYDLVEYLLQAGSDPKQIDLTEVEDKKMRRLLRPDRVKR